MREDQGLSEEPKESFWGHIRQRLFTMVSVGVINDRINQSYDVVSTGLLILNLVVSVALTFDGAVAAYGTILRRMEAVTVAFFALDYVLRLLTAKLLYPESTEPVAVLRYVTSFTGIIDILSFLPYYLPVFFPAGAAAFRMFRVARILRLFRINAYYDSLNVITEVVVGKRRQLLSAVFILMVLMLASSLCMYSLEHEAQPRVFSNAFSGIWWSMSTLLTVGYGDIYPVTPMGKLFGILIAFLGVGVVAIPTGIISAGFVEQYTRLKRMGEIAEEADIHFIKVELQEEDDWCDREIRSLRLPHGMLIAGVQRGAVNLVPRGALVLRGQDTVILAAEALQRDRPVNIREIILKKEHPWNGSAIKDLDISRQSFIIMVKRGNGTLIPRGNLILREGDKVFQYSAGAAALHERTETP